MYVIAQANWTMFFWDFAVFLSKLNTLNISFLWKQLNSNIHVKHEGCWMEFVLVDKHETAKEGLSDI